MKNLFYLKSKYNFIYRALAKKMKKSTKLIQELREACETKVGIEFKMPEVARLDGLPP